MADEKNNPLSGLGNLGNLGKPAANPDTTAHNATGSSLGASLGAKAGAAAASAAREQGTEYEVQSGDTLSGIGQRFGVPWREIYEANKDQIKDPDMIHVGWKLKIPGK
jgi:nucleoid-associated protein YgaU